MSWPYFHYWAHNVPHKDCHKETRASLDYHTRKQAEPIQVLGKIFTVC